MERVCQFELVRIDEFYPKFTKLVYSNLEISICNTGLEISLIKLELPSKSPIMKKISMQFGHITFSGGAGKTSLWSPIE
jgi:hypothetical protein